MSKHPGQLGFDGLLQEADRDNAAREFDCETAHLPDSWTEAVDCHRQQISDYHAAMLANDFDAALAIRKDAHLLAAKLNGGRHGIIAGEDAPGCRLARAAAADPGAIPLWGQGGVFPLEAAGLAMRVEMSGLFGICATAMPFLGFAVRAVDAEKPFLSATGYRSFMGVSVEPWRGVTTDSFVRRVVERYVENELKGRVLRVDS